MVNCSAVNALCIMNNYHVLNLSFETLCKGMTFGLVYLVDFFYHIHYDKMPYCSYRNIIDDIVCTVQKKRNKGFSSYSNVQ